MKRILAGLALVLTLFFATEKPASPQMVSSGGGGTGTGTTSLNQFIREYPFSGTFVISVDDGFRWVYTDLLDTLRAINEDSLLTGTPGAMKACLFVNPRGENSLADVQWLTPPSPQQNADPSDQCTEQMIRELHNSGLIEIGLHGYYHQLNDPESLGLSPPSARVTGFRWKAPGSPASAQDSTSYSMITNGLKAIRDTIGVPCVSFVTPGHRMTTYMAYLFNQWGVNACRAGSMQTPVLATNWPNAATGGTPVNVQQGKIRELNRQNIDMINALLCSNIVGSGADTTMGHRMEAYLPFADLNRLWIPHLNPPTSNASSGTGQPQVTTAAAREDTTKAIIYYLAAQSALGVMVYHDINIDGGVEGVGGMAGFSRILRYAAGLCRNLAENRDGPRLQVLTLSEAAAKHSDWRQCLAGQSFDVVNNFHLKKDEWRASKPYGFHEGLEDVWADSGWAFVDSATAAGNTFFGVHGEGGLFRNVVSTATLTSPLIQVFSVPPGASVQFGCYATADTFETTLRAGPTLPDSIAGTKIAIEVTFMRAVPDPTDTLSTWIRDPTVATQYASAGNWNEDAAGAGATAPAIAHSQEDWTGNTIPRWNPVRMWGGFHWRDQWRVARLTTGGEAGNYWFMEDSALDNEQMRWRPFYTWEVVPDGCRIAVVKYRPIGFISDTATPDTICISGITVQVDP